ncbi:multiple sugar transport system permease protein [Inquilinus ginsengisoli]|uniref:Multiple sugar transport system permease protein n=1 Tax=Inquilinus ginsengisoli TaxID=363840 RepID=A0ABU1JSB0_9PROT|nr:sugar ABC transporter permease [Inquilinus ginsengisoli]MDR6291177.1 multiple sugar transport system permease protein [Inquilinus ginsengisoli]
MKADAAVQGPVLAIRASGHRPTRAGQVRRTALKFLAPAGILFLILIANPLLRVLWDSLHIVNLVNPSVTGFAGWDNYRTVWEDGDFLPALGNTAIWTGLSVAGEYALGLASAVALAQPVRFRAIFRGVIIIPWVIPIAVAGLNWTWMLTPDYGILNVWMVDLGLLDRPYPWLGQIDTALLTVTFVNIWRSYPFYTISLLAALQAIPRELHEAAAVDGAGAWRRFRVITLPHLRTVSLTLIFIHIIWTAINFDFIWVMTEGGPLNASETLPIMIYRYAMQDFDVGAACALASLSMAFMACLFFVYYYGVARRRAA